MNKSLTCFDEIVSVPVSLPSFRSKRSNLKLFERYNSLSSRRLRQSLLVSIFPLDRGLKFKQKKKHLNS